MAAVPSTLSITSDNSQNDSDTDLSLINTEDELHTDLILHLKERNYNI